MTVPEAERWSRERVAEAVAGQVLLAPLTRGGNLPFRRTCIAFGARITCSEMAHAKHLARGLRRELALLRHHPDESLFGVQLAARTPELAVAGARVALEHGARFIDVNAGCPIRSVVQRGEGAALLRKPRRLERLLEGLRAAIDVPLFLKIRIGFDSSRLNAVEIARLAEDCGVDALTVHGRTREQRYRRAADWDRISQVAAAVGIPAIGNGDLLTVQEVRHRLATSGCAAVMLARGALIKPWLWEDIAAGDERPRDATERMRVYRGWIERALERWGADELGFRRVREFLEFHVDWWRRHVPPDAIEGVDLMEGRTRFTPRDELERLLLAEGDDGIARACDALLEPFEPPASALSSTGRIDATAGGWC